MFSAPVSVEAGELLEFSESVESDARKWDLPTMVLEAVFDTPERRELSGARRVVRG